MDREHIFHPERASDDQLEAALLERALNYFADHLLPWMDKPRILTEPEYCESAHGELAVIHSKFRHVLDDPRRERLGELEFFRRSIDSAGSQARQHSIDAVRGSHLSSAERQREFIKAEASARNRQITLLGGVRWYQEHQQAFNDFIGLVENQCQLNERAVRNDAA